MEKAFFQRQIKELLKEGPKALPRKFYNLLLVFLAPLAVLVVRLLRPFKVIRFAALKSNRIGHFAANTELYLCEKDSGMHLSNTLDIFYYALPICNQQLNKMWKRKLCILHFVRWFDHLNRFIPGGRIHQIPLPLDLDRHNFLATIPAHLSFTAEEESLGISQVRNLGLPDGIEFICFYARDSAYLNAKFPFYDWNYHNYRDANINNYILAAEKMAQRGYFAIRMGAIVKEALKTDNPRIIDYANSGRTDFLDIFLSAKCRFFISSCTGLDAVPRIFRRPMVYVNFVPLGLEHFFNCAPHSLFIPKKLWLRREKRILTFSEIVGLGADKFYLNQKYENLRIEVIENTPEEISAVAEEMDERLKGTWQTSKEDEELQQLFWSLFKPSQATQALGVRIGTEFLRQHRKFIGVEGD